MTGKELYKLALSATEEAKSRPRPEYLDDDDDSFSFTMSKGNMLSQVRNVIEEDDKLILSATPKGGWFSFESITSDFILNSLKDSDKEVFMRMNDETHPVESVKNDFFGVNEDDEGWNFVEFHCE